MKRILLLIYMLLFPLFLSAETPVQELISRYTDVKGMRNMVAKGPMMSMVRPMLKNYTIAPMADHVEELSALRLGRGVSPEDKARFLKELRVALKSYIYVGKTKSTSGIVDAYVHQASADTVDELVVFNPETNALNTLLGVFPASELMALKQDI